VTALAPPGAMPVLCQPIEDAATPAQALGLARLAAADAALAHGSLALAALEDGMVLIAQIDPARFEAWQQAVVATVGRPADALVPAALVLPPPAAGTVYRAALGGMDLARTPVAAFAAEPPLWQALVLPDMRVVPCSDAVMAGRLAQAHARPWLDVLGETAIPTAAPPRRLAWLAMLVLLLALAVPVAQIARWRMAAAHAEANALAQVRARFPVWRT
jgi:general secretion pathway protein L